MQIRRFRMTAALRRWFIVGLAGALFITNVGVAGAGVGEDNELRSEVRLNPPLVGFYDYQLGTAASWSTDSDFDSAGTHSGTTAQDVADSLTLARIGPPGVTDPDPTKPWWDEDWETRTCFDITHPATGSDVTEYPLRVTFDLAALVAAGVLQADHGDLRAVSKLGNQMPVWAETSSTVWVQMDEMLAGTSTWFCFYYNYEPGTLTAPANHTEAAVFTYTTFKPIYYAVSERYDTAGSAVDVVSYAAGNEVRRGAQTLALANPGDRVTFPGGGNSADSIFEAKGPIAAKGVADGFDSLVPISFAGTEFVVPTARGTNRFSIYAPFGDTDVTIADGPNPPYASFTVADGTSYTEGSGDINDPNAAIILASRPVLVTHHAGSDDATPIYPATDASLYGMRSQYIRVASLNAGTATINDSAGGTSSVPLTPGVTIVLGPGAVDGGGPGDAYRITGAGKIGALQQDDGDGNESTLFLPRSELNTEYWIPGPFQYVATSCINGSAQITLTPAGPSRTFPCAGSGPGKGLDATPGLPATHLESDGSAFYAYFESSVHGDEKLMLGMKQGRQYTYPEPSVSGAGPAEGLLQASGTWTSDNVDSGAVGARVYGEIDFAGLDPAAGTLEIRVATSAAPGPTDFVGPSGLSSDFWSVGDLPSVLDFDHDGDRYLRVQIEMTTTDRIGASPRIDHIAVDYNLPLVAREAGSAASLVIVDPTSSPLTTYLARVRTEVGGVLGTSQLFVTGGDWTNLASGALRLENVAIGLDSIQWTESAATPTPIAFDPASPHSIVLDHHKSAGPDVTIETRWQLNVSGPGSIFIQGDITTEVRDS
jgi:hypothetical protein